MFVDMCSFISDCPSEAPYTALQVPDNEATSLGSAVPRHSVQSCNVVGTGQCAPRAAVESLKHSRTENFVAVAQERVRHPNVWSVIAKWQRTEDTAARPRSGSRRFKVDDKMRDLLVMIMESDPYSPFLNSVENMFSVLKADLKQRLSTSRSARTIGRRGWRPGTAVAAWCNALPHGASLSWRIWCTRPCPAVIAQEKVCAACYRHANSFLGVCLGREG